MGHHPAAELAEVNRIFRYNFRVSDAGQRSATRHMLETVPLTCAGYNSKGFRLVAGVVPLSPDQEYVLLIQSTRRKGWVLPKGGWEIDESCQEAAVREAWEEAGITIEVEFELGTIEELRPPKLSKDQSQYHFFQGTVVSQYEEWPESHKRERQWFTFTQAIEALSTRPELQEMQADL